MFAFSICLHASFVECLLLDPTACWTRASWSYSLQPYYYVVKRLWDLKTFFDISYNIGYSLKSWLINNPQCRPSLFQFFSRSTLFVLPQFTWTWAHTWSWLKQFINVHLNPLFVFYWLQLLTIKQQALTPFLSPCGCRLELWLGGVGMRKAESGLRWRFFYSFLFRGPWASGGESGEKWTETEDCGVPKKKNNTDLG